MLKMMSILLFSTACYANPMLFTKNLDGGLIVATDEPCYNTKTYKIYSYHHKLGVVKGCYVLNKSFINAKWQTGIDVSYSIEIFKPVERHEEENALLGL